MVHPFISSPAGHATFGRMGGVSLSVVVHTALIAGAVAATTPSPIERLTSDGDIDRARMEHIRYVRAVPAGPTRPVRKAKRGVAAKPAALAFVLMAIMLVGAIIYARVLGTERITEG